MRKSKAVKMTPGTIVLFEDHWCKHLSYSERLGRVIHVTPRGGVLAQPVWEVFGVSGATYKPYLQPQWMPYSKVFLFKPPARRQRSAAKGKRGIT